MSADGSSGSSHAGAQRVVLELGSPGLLRLSLFGCSSDLGSRRDSICVAPPIIGLGLGAADL